MKLMQGILSLIYINKVGFNKLKTTFFFLNIIYSNCYQHYKLLKLNPQAPLSKKLCLIKNYL